MTPNSFPSHLERYRTRNWWANDTIGERARRLAERNQDGPAFITQYGTTTYGEIFADAMALAGSLQKLGLRRGDVISLQLPNWVEVAVINIAAALLGLVVNPIIPAYRDGEVSHILRNGSSRFIFIAERWRSNELSQMLVRLRPELPELCGVCLVRSSTSDLTYDELVRAGRGQPVDLQRIDPDSRKLLLFTSGTTGRPKAVLHSHNTLSRVHFNQARRYGVVPGSRLLSVSPVTHITGYATGIEMPFAVESVTVMLEHWNAGEALRLIEEHRVVGMIAATPFLAELADAARVVGTRLDSLTFFACGGAGVPAQLIRDANAVFRNPCAFRIYGSSEVPLVTAGRPHLDWAERGATTDGEILEEYEVRIVDDDGREVANGTEGEVLARGPMMFLGYLDPVQTADSLTADGYFRTGDIGRRADDGTLVITDRKKDLIIRGGQNISPSEIEEAILRHPRVAEVAVVSMPHPRLGEGICAFVVPREGAQLDFDGVAACVERDGLARYKTPERVEFVQELPHTPAGKIRKDVLRARIRDIVAAAAEAAPSAG